MREDSIEGIYDTLTQCAVVSKAAGGIGLAVSCIRATGSYIAGVSKGNSAELKEKVGFFLFFLLHLLMFCFGVVVFSLIRPMGGPTGLFRCFEFTITQHAMSIRGVTR